MESRDLALLYKRETGKDVCWNELSVTRKRGQWFFEASDEDIIDTFGYTGTLKIPDLEYINWLEKKLSEKESP